MKFYWKASEIPELAHLPPDARKQVWRAALLRALFHWTTLTAWVVLFLLGRFAVAPLLGMDKALGSAIGAAAGMMLAWQIAVSDVRKGREATKRAQDAWFVRSIVVAGLLLCVVVAGLVGVVVWLAPGAEARLEVDLSASKIEMAGGHYVVHGAVVNKGRAAGSTSMLKVTFLHNGAELGSRTYPMKKGPIAPGQRLDFTQQLDEAPAGTTDVTPSVDTVGETSGRSRMGTLANYARA